MSPSNYCRGGEEKDNKIKLRQIEEKKQNKANTEAFDCCLEQHYFAEPPWLFTGQQDPSGQDTQEKGPLSTGLLPHS